MYRVLTIVRSVMYIVPLILLITSIKTKNKFITTNNFRIGIFIMVYLVLDLFFIPNFFGIDMGWASFFNFFFLVIAFIILIIGISINLIKLSKNLNEDSNFFIKHYSKLSILPILLIVMTFIFELSIINNAELILLFNYNHGIISRTTTKIAVSPNSVKPFTIAQSFIKNSPQSIDYIHYDVEENALNEVVITGSYKDPNLEKIDMDVVKKIYKDERYEQNESALKLHKNDKNVVHKAYMIKIEGTDYYIVHHLLSEEGKGGGSGLGSAVYYNDTFIADLNAHGDLSEVYLYTK